MAVKQLKPGASKEEKVKFLREAAINGQFRHPNVVKLMGVVKGTGPVRIIYIKCFTVFCLNLYGSFEPLHLACSFQKQNVCFHNHIQYSLPHLNSSHACVHCD